MNQLRRLVREAHRRSVWQVLGIYLVGAWIGYQVVLNVMQGFGLPDWVAPFALVLFVIGLPIVLATAFVQEGGPERSDFARQPAGPHQLVPGFSTAADELQFTPAPAVSTLDAQSSTLAKRLTWPKAILGGIVAFLVLGASTAGYMGLRSAGIGPMGSLVGRGELNERDAIVLANFTSSGGDADLASAVTEAFRVDFEQSTIVRLVGAQQIGDVLRRMQRESGEPLTESLAREVAEREGYKAVLTGEVNAVGAGYVLSARLNAPDGRVLVSARETAADSTEVLAAIDALSGTLRERIGESLRTIRAGQPLEQVTTASLEALRRYTQAMRVRDEGDPFRAIELLEQAIAIDSGFAMAWRKIGAIAVSPGMDPELRVRATTRAYELSERLTERERHLAAAAWFGWVAGDDDAAMREYRAVLDVDPDNTTALNNLASAYAVRGDYDQAVAMSARAVEIGGSAVFYQNHAEHLFAVGRVDEARAVLERARELYPTNDVAALYLAALEAASGDLAASDSIIAQPGVLEGPDPNLVAGFYWQSAANHATRGRLREALRRTRAMERTVAEYSPGEALVIAVWRGHLVLGATGDATRALRELDDALDRHSMEEMTPLQRPYAPMITLLLLAGADERASAMIAEMQTAIPDDQRGAFRSAELYITATRHIRAGEPGRAEAVMEEIAAETPCDACALAHLAEAYAAAGDTAHAIELYERFLAEPFMWRTGEADATSLANALVALAELHEQTGDLDAAARNYARFVELWQDADAEFQPRVRAAQARLEAIVARRG